METMEEYKTIRILNEEPEFCENVKQDFSADFFILCDENNRLFGKEIYNSQIAGMSVLNWVVRACGRQPKILKVCGEEDALSVIRPYVNGDAEYSVVLYADTPLVNKSHLLDLLNFVDIRRMNVCKLKRGFIFKNDYIIDNDEFFSIDEYDFASNDFFQIETSENFSYAAEILSKKIIDFHKRSGVYFENEKNVTIDANVEIGAFSKIGAGVCVLKGSKLGENCIVAQNSIVSGSRVGNNSTVGAGTKIFDSILKDKVTLFENVFVIDSVIGKASVVDYNSSVANSSVKENCGIKSYVCVDSSKIGDNTLIQSHAKILGLLGKTIIGEACEVGENTEICDSVLKNETFIGVNLKINNRVDE